MRRRRSIELQPLEPGLAAEYAAQWGDVQIQFVDTPQEACNQAQRLLTSVLRARGSPVDARFELPGQDVGPRRPEDVRAAFVAYRALFSDLVSPLPGDP